MSQQPHQPGFVMPSAPEPSYPQYPQYPPQPPTSHGHHQPPPAYNHQPFPAPIQHQPPYGNQPYSGGGVVAYNDFQAYLRNTSMFFVKQKVEVLEILVGWETGNKYTVKDQAGNKIFFVGEETGCLNRNCCGKYRPFTLVVKDMRGMDVLRIDRPLDCACFCGLICPDAVEVSSANGQKLGSVVEDFHLIYPTLSIKDATGITRLKLEGPACPLALCGQPVVFRVTTPDGVSIGSISKEYGGLIRELFTDADSFNITFPPDLDSAIKAVLLGALFLIDYEYFESGGNSGGQGGRRIFG